MSQRRPSVRWEAGLAGGLGPTFSPAIVPPRLQDLRERGRPLFSHPRQRTCVLPAGGGEAGPRDNRQTDAHGTATLCWAPCYTPSRSQFQISLPVNSAKYLESRFLQIKYPWHSDGSKHLPKVRYHGLSVPLLSECPARAPHGPHQRFADMLKPPAPRMGEELWGCHGLNWVPEIHLLEPWPPRTSGSDCTWRGVFKEVRKVKWGHGWALTQCNQCLCKKRRSIIKIYDRKHTCFYLPL